eukprot:jgi/Hompol1/5590/HPOL_004589-RA
MESTAAGLLETLQRLVVTAERADSELGSLVAKQLAEAAWQAQEHLHEQICCLKTVLVDIGISAAADLDVQLQPATRPNQSSVVTAAVTSTPIQKSPHPGTRSDMKRKHMSPFTPTIPHSLASLSTTMRGRDRDSDPDAPGFTYSRLTDFEDEPEHLALEDLGLSAISLELLASKRAPSQRNVPVQRTAGNAVPGALASPAAPTSIMMQMYPPPIPDESSKRSGSISVGVMDSPLLAPAVVTSTAFHSQPGQLSLYGLSEKEFLSIDRSGKPHLSRQLIEETINEINELAADKRLMDINATADTFTISELAKSSQIEPFKLTDILAELVKLNRVSVASADSQTFKMVIIQQTQSRAG